MDSDYLTGGFAHEKELHDLEERLVLLQSELTDEGDSGHGRPRQAVEDEIAGIEAKIKLFKTPMDEA